MKLSVVDCGALASLQDLGRPGFQRLGVPVGGAMDWFALQAANRLVGSPPGAAVIEIGQGGLELTGDGDCLAAVTGCGYGLALENCGRTQFYPLWTAVRWRAGEKLRLLPRPQAGWAYLAVSGGIDAPLVLGSRSTYLPGGFGGWQGRLLQPGDVLPVAGNPPPAQDALARPGASLPENCRPAYSACPALGVIPGPHLEAFSPAGLEIFFSSRYTLSPRSDRMGCRFCGPAIQHTRPGAQAADVLSEGLPLGAVQIPGDGLPIIALADRQTTGGYTRLGTVCLADLPLLAQLRHPWGQASFYEIDVEYAQERGRRLIEGLSRIETGGGMTGR